MIDSVEPASSAGTSPSSSAVPAITAPAQPRRQAGQSIGICAGLALVAIACFWTRVPAIYSGSPDVPPASLSLPPAPPVTPSTALATELLQASFQVNSDGREITWSLQNTGKFNITGLYVSLYDQRYLDRRVDIEQTAVLPPGQFATHTCKWFTGLPTVKVDSATVESR